MDNNILSALKAIDVATLSRADWIAVGMALKEEGYPCSIWDDWSRNDKRYHPGECERKWNSFHGSGTPVKGGTIVQMAKERGWTPFSGEDGCLNWDDAIEYDGADGFNGFTAPDSWSPSADLITYLELLFDADDRVGYVTNDVWQDAEGKWLPSKGVYDRTAGELIASLKKHPDDLGATIGDWKPQVGAWIRFNPLDGDGVKNENITKFRFALVESDTLPVAEQDIVFRKLELPIAALVHSGGKSLHAIVRVDAESSSTTSWRKTECPSTNRTAIRPASPVCRESPGTATASTLLRPISAGSHGWTGWISWRASRTNCPTWYSSTLSRTIRRNCRRNLSQGFSAEDTRC